MARETASLSERMRKAIHALAKGALTMSKNALADAACMMLVCNNSRL